MVYFHCIRATWVIFFVSGGHTVYFSSVRRPDGVLSLYERTIWGIIPLSGGHMGHFPGMMGPHEVLSLYEEAPRGIILEWMATRGIILV